MQQILADFGTWMHSHMTWWVAIGFLGQAMFTMRFVYQWIYSERVNKSVVPEAFWYFSLAGGTILFTYAVYRQDPVFMLGQGTGVLIYLRNIHLIWREKLRGRTAVV